MNVNWLYSSTCLNGFLRHLEKSSITEISYQLLYQLASHLGDWQSKAATGSTILKLFVLVFRSQQYKSVAIESVLYSLSME